LLVDAGEGVIGQPAALRQSACAFGPAAFGIIGPIRDHSRVVTLALGAKVGTQASAIDGKFQKSSRMGGIVIQVSVLSKN
jgi:hypothetical protein